MELIYRLPYLIELDAGAVAMSARQRCTLNLAMGCIAVCHSVRHTYSYTWAMRACVHVDLIGNISTVTWTMPCNLNKKYLRMQCRKSKTTCDAPASASPLPWCILYLLSTSIMTTMLATVAVAMSHLPLCHHWCMPCISLFASLFHITLALRLSQSVRIHTLSH